jgi:tetrahydromethanopterin S-methyltransferase subunit D
MLEMLLKYFSMMEVQERRYNYNIEGTVLKYHTPDYESNELLSSIIDSIVTKIFILDLK